MPAGHRSITIERYADFYEEYQVLDNGTPRNITGAAIKMSLKLATPNAGIDYTYAVGTGITITNAALGKFAVTIPRTDTANMSGTYKYDILITQGTTARLVEGDCVIKDGVGT